MIISTLKYPGNFLYDCKASPGPICLEPECVIASGVILSALDQTADPCQDFYQYACGGWLDVTEIPPWDSSASKSFGDLYYANLKIIKTVEFLQNGCITITF